MKYNKQWLSESEIELMLNSSNITERQEIYILLMYSCALRVTEAINVRVKDLDYENNCIDIWGGKGRDTTELSKVPCDTKILKTLRRFCEHSNLRPNDYIMYSQKSKQVSRSQVYKILNQICKDAGIDKKIGTHTMRRSRASNLLNNGLELVYVSKLLRHKNLSTTMTYLSISVADIQKELAKINDSVGCLA